MEEHTCRICRGEGTQSQPLYHPCKCRGSIKYIHQDCLFEWLKHSNKSTKKCDICNMEYKFRTTYDPSMPARIPLAMIWSKTVSICMATGVKVASSILYALLVVQLPLFWKFCGRVYTWAIDGTLPPTNGTTVNALLFGNFDVSSYLSTLKDTSGIEKLLVYGQLILENTYYSGLRHVFVFAVVHVALFVEHEWVVRDEGYTKALLKRIGKEPRTKLVDMLQQALTGLRNDGNNGNHNAVADLQHLETLARAISDLEGDQERGDRAGQSPEDVLRQAIENDEYREGREREGRDDEEEEREEEERNERNEREEEEEEEREEERNERNTARQLLAQAQAQMDREAQEEARAVAVEQEALEAAQEAEGDNAADIFELFGLVLNIKTPILLMVIADLIITSYLFVFYFIPHMLGNALAGVIRTVLRFSGVFLGPRVRWLGVLWSNSVDFKVSGVVREDSFAEFGYLTLKQYVADPVLRVLAVLFVEPAPGQPVSLVERVLMLSIGYSFVAYTMYVLMSTISAAQKPVMGTPRKIYKVLFEITATLKVFFIFSIEIFFFPVYCGWLLDFCGAPLILPSFIRTNSDGSKSVDLLFTCISKHTQASYILLFTHWAVGTMYMVWFALFVGMVRGKILRPGVLFFLRSPEDPNARLIHDALVKPLMLQLMRIYLSAKVYTGFILVGIGGVTWSLRFYMSSQTSTDTFVPGTFTDSKGNAVYSMATLYILVAAVANGFNLVVGPYGNMAKDYCYWYWKWVFEVSAHKLRLSHFILGKPVSQERGYVVYRDLYHSLLGNSQPDYSRPTTYREALALFESDPSIKACFVPNGSYIRVPDNDTVSRKFVKKLFVQVTRDDKLLKAASAEPAAPNYETPSSEDDDLSVDNAYSIVYRPPNFKTRCFGLFCVLWLFAIVLILWLVAMCLVVGRPVVQAWILVSGSSHQIKYSLPFNWNTELISLSVGARLVAFALWYVEKWNHGGENEIDGFVDARNAAAEPVARVVDAPNAPGQDFMTRAIKDLLNKSFFLMAFMVYQGSIHSYCIDIPFKYYYGFNVDQLYVNVAGSRYLFNRYTVPVHILVAAWSLNDIRFTLASTGTSEESYAQTKKCFRLCIVNGLSLFIPMIMLYGYLTHAQYDYWWKVYSNPFVFAIYASIKSAMDVHYIYSVLQDMVRNEKYVSGRVIENVED